MATASTDNVDFVRSLGAETVIDYTRTPFEQAVRDVDLVLDAIGGQVLQRSMEVVKRGGRLISLLEEPSQEKAQERGIIAINNQTRPTVNHLKTIARLIDEGVIKAIVGKKFPLHEVRQAHELCDTGHGRGRIVLHIAD